MGHGLGDLIFTVKKGQVLCCCCCLKWWGEGWRPFLPCVMTLLAPCARHGPGWPATPRQGCGVREGCSSTMCVPAMQEMQGVIQLWVSCSKQGSPNQIMV